MTKYSLPVDRFVTKNEILVHDVVEIPGTEEHTEWVVLQRRIHPSDSEHLQVYAQLREIYDRNDGNGWIPLFDLANHDVIYVKEHLF